MRHLLGLIDQFAFIAKGVRKLRLTGGEPLVRKNIMHLVRQLGAHVHEGRLDELTLTTNGSQLARHAAELADCGVRRINVSLDTLDPQKFRAITRWGELSKVMEGTDAAQAAGLKIKINAVALKDFNDREIPALMRWAHGRGMDLTLIEEMPLGAAGHDRSESFLPLDRLRRSLSGRWTLVPVEERTGGPARYVRIGETGGRLGFITPLSCDFCGSCNRVRVSCTGDLFTCMGEEGAVGLREALRGDGSGAAVDGLVRQALSCKPKGHAFGISGKAVSGIARPMSVLGG